MDIANSIGQNSTLLRLGIHFHTLGPRAKVQDVLKRNWDKRKIYLNKISKVLNKLIKFLVRLRRINEKLQQSSTNADEDEE